MRKQIIPLLLVIIFFTLTSGKTPDITENFVKFDKNVYVCKYELTNFEYRTFLDDLKAQKKDEEFTKCTPDSTQWVEKFNFSFNQPFTNMYHWHPSYNNYPVVNISKDAIDYYCTWITNKYNTNPKRKIKKVVFRLPTEQEWMKFSSPLPDHRLPWYGNFPYEENNKKCITILANIKVKDYATNKYDYVQDGGMIAVSVGNYRENNIDIYDIIGNVAEVTSDGKIKGGSWSNTLEECFIDKSQDYSLPDPRVGFRLVMEIIEK